LNFEETRWPEKLTSHPQFETTAKNLWIAEGFFMYFDEWEVERLLNVISGLSPAGMLRDPKVLIDTEL
jgi:O-methyltransferase involved in polyketide biosynthesis